MSYPFDSVHSYADIENLYNQNLITYPNHDLYGLSASVVEVGDVYTNYVYILKFSNCYAVSCSHKKTIKNAVCEELIKEKNLTELTCTSEYYIELDEAEDSFKNIFSTFYFSDKVILNKPVVFTKFAAANNNQEAVSTTLAQNSTSEKYINTVLKLYEENSFINNSKQDYYPYLDCLLSIEENLMYTLSYEAKLIEIIYPVKTLIGSYGEFISLLYAAFKQYGTIDGFIVHICSIKPQNLLIRNPAEELENFRKNNDQLRTIPNIASTGKLRKIGSTQYKKIISEVILDKSKKYKIHQKLNKLVLVSNDAYLVGMVSTKSGNFCRGTTKLRHLVTKLYEVYCPYTPFERATYSQTYGKFWSTEVPPLTYIKLLKMLDSFEEKYMH